MGVPILFPSPHFIVISNRLVQKKKRNVYKMPSSMVWTDLIPADPEVLHLVDGIIDRITLVQRESMSLTNHRVP